MDVQSATTFAAGPTLAPAAQAPTAPESDGRASADAVASTTAPRPEVPLPMPPSPSQTGLVSKAALKETDVETTGKTPDDSPAGESDLQRIMKPYGISMLPEKFDAPKQDTPDPE